MILQRVDELLPNHQIAVVFYAPHFVRENPDAARRLMVAYLQGVRDYNDAYRKGINKDKVIDILAVRTQVARDVIAQSYPPGLDPDQRATVEAMDVFQKFYQEQNLVRKPIDVKQLIDTFFAEAALKVLGPYK